MFGIPQLISAPLNPISNIEHFRRSHTISVQFRADKIAKFLSGQ